MAGKTSAPAHQPIYLWIAFGTLCGLAGAGLILLLVSPRRGQPITLTPAATRPPATATLDITETPTPEPTSVFPININTADEFLFEQLPGIGPSLAASIVAYREANGPFETLEDLQKVPNIGPRTFEAIRPFIAIEE